MGLIVAVRGEEKAAPGDRHDFPVLSIDTGADSGYVLERLYFFDDMTRMQWVHEPTRAPHDFNIGKYRFVKEGDAWYYVKESHGHTCRYKIAYGADVLESYGNGEMFKRLLAIQRPD